MIYEALFNGTRLTLALHNDHNSPAGLHQDFLKFAEGIHRKSTEESLGLFLLSYKMLRQRQLAEFGDLTHIALGRPCCQILCIIDFKESANLIE